MKKKLKNCNVCFRLTEEDKLLLQTKVKESGYSLQTFLEKLVFSDDKIFPRDEVAKLVFEINKIGVNLNQLLKLFYSTNADFDLTPFEECVEECQYLNSQIRKKILKEK